MAKDLVLLDGWYFVNRVKFRCTAIYLPISPLNSIDIDRKPIIETTEGIFGINFQNFGTEVLGITTQNCNQKVIKVKCEKNFKATWQGKHQFFGEKSDIKSKKAPPLPDPNKAS